ncbi:MAG: DUF484 family protein [Chitinophagaceae bacterium]|nr:DUF484 family protein [Rubrivivax sp.]
MTIQGITEGDIANYLVNNPAFFERHAELLSSVQLTSPHGQRAVSLQERQMEMLRERIKGLEMRIMEMIRHSQENVAIADRLHRWTRSILLTANAAALPATMVDTLKHQFLIPQAAVRLWGAAGQYAGESFAQPVSDDVKSFVGSLSLPYCGVNAGFEASGWLDEPGTVMSLAMIPLRHSLGAEGSFGLLVLGSPDPTRYAAEMGTEFLMRIGEVASAALSRLLPTPG